MHAATQGMQILKVLQVFCLVHDVYEGLDIFLKRNNKPLGPKQTRHVHTRLSLNKLAHSFFGGLEARIRLDDLLNIGNVAKRRRG